MANKTIPQLPEQTGKTDDDLLVIVDSGETTTSKIKVSTLLDGVGGSPYIPADGTNNVVSDYYATSSINSGATESVIIGGSGNTITNVGKWNGIFAGRNSTLNSNDITYGGSVMLGGGNNIINNTGSITSQSIVAGYSNVITGSGLWGTTFIGGGTNSDAIGENNTMLGGNFTDINSGESNFAVGRRHQITGVNNGSIGGDDNDISISVSSGIFYGSANDIVDGTNSVILGGTLNSIGFRNSAILAGTNNVNNSDGGAVVGGSGNKLLGDGNGHGIFCGNANEVSGGMRDSVIIGGQQNTITRTAGAGYSQNQAIILGGELNNLHFTGDYPNPAIVGGISNGIEDSPSSVIIGGSGHTISGHTNSVILGGSGLTSNYNNEVLVPNLTIANYPSLNFSGDTAAAAAGIVLGQVYHDNGNLRVRIT